MSPSARQAADTHDVDPSPARRYRGDDAALPMPATSIRSRRLTVDAAKPGRLCGCLSPRTERTAETVIPARARAVDAVVDDECRGPSGGMLGSPDHPTILTLYSHCTHGNALVGQAIATRASTQPLHGVVQPSWTPDSTRPGTCGRSAGTRARGGWRRRRQVGTTTQRRDLGGQSTIGV